MIIIDFEFDVSPAVYEFIYKTTKQRNDMHQNSIDENKLTC